MPLADVLSAMRVLILDGVALPAEEPARVEALRFRFPALRPEEAEDLAQIAPAKFGLYSQTIFTGEGNLLARYFPITFALLRRAAGAAADELHLAQTLHKSRPWLSYRTGALIDNFEKFIAEDIPEVLAKEPGIADVARMESASYRVLRAPDSADEGTPLTVESASSLLVPQLLELVVRLPKLARLGEFSFDVVSYRERFIENGRELPEEKLHARLTFGLGIRVDGYRVPWLPLSGPFYEVLNRRYPFTLGELAESYIAARGATAEEEDPAALFSQFMSELAPLLAVKALRLEDPTLL